MQYPPLPDGSDDMDGASRSELDQGAALEKGGKVEKGGNAGLNALKKLNVELCTSVIAGVRQKETEAALANLPEFGAYALVSKKLAIQNAIAEIVGDIAPTDVMFDVSPSHAKADLTIKLRKGAKPMNEFKDVLIPKIMAALPAKLPWLSVEQVGIYINLSFNREDLIRGTLSDVNRLKDDYGNSDVNKGRKVVIDFSSPNTAKTMHLGHLRSTIIGQTLVNLLNSTGALTYGINHLGDWGTQFGHLVTAHKLWASDLAKEMDVEKNPVAFLAELYRRISDKKKEEEGNPDQPLTEEGRRNFALLEAGDPEITNLWLEFRRLSLLEFDRVYKRLGIHFDHILGESFYEDKMTGPVEDAKAKQLAIEDDKGGLVVDMTDAGLPTFLLRKSDGASNYHTRDMAAIRYRMQTFEADRMLYVVGNEQQTHLRQCFELARRIGDVELGVCKHIRFGLMKQGGKKIASRAGKAPGLEDYLDTLKEKAAEMLAIKNVGLDAETVEESAEKIAIAALVYSNFMQGIERDMDFNPEDMLNLDAQSGPYVQYTCVRIQSMLSKIYAAYPKGQNDSGTETEVTDDVLQKTDKSAQDLAYIIAEFPETVAKVSTEYNLHQLAEYLFKLANAFNLFYTKSEKVLKINDESLRSFYVQLIEATDITLKKGLAIFNIEVPKKM